MNAPVLSRSSANGVVLALSLALALGTGTALGLVSADAGAAVSSSILVGLSTLMLGGWLTARAARV